MKDWEVLQELLMIEHVSAFEGSMAYQDRKWKTILMVKVLSSIAKHNVGVATWSAIAW